MNNITPNSGGIENLIQSFKPMTNPFTNLETMLIRAKMDTHSDSELAEILERPAEEIHEYIDMITGGEANARSNQVQELKDRRHSENLELKRGRGSSTSEEARNKRLKSIKETVDRNNERAREKELDRKQRTIQAEIRKRNEERKRSNDMMNSRRTYKTKTVDYSQMRSVKVGKGTYIFIPKDADIKQAVESYEQNYRQGKPEWQKKISDN
jgi:hypothetical protein